VHHERIYAFRVRANEARDLLSLPFRERAERAAVKRTLRILRRAVVGVNDQALHKAFRPWKNRTLRADVQERKDGVTLAFFGAVRVRVRHGAYDDML